MSDGWKTSTGGNKKERSEAARESSYEGDPREEVIAALATVEEELVSALTVVRSKKWLNIPKEDLVAEVQLATFRDVVADIWYEEDLDDIAIKLTVDWDDGEVLGSRRHLLSPMLRDCVECICDPIDNLDGYEAEMIGSIRSHAERFISAVEPHLLSARKIVERCERATPYQDGRPPCTCNPDCPAPCKGSCGCERCSEDYGDFLSAER